MVAFSQGIFQSCMDVPGYSNLEPFKIGGAPKPLNFREFGPFAGLPMGSVSPNHSGKERIYSSKLSWLGCGMG